MSDREIELGCAIELCLERALVLRDLDDLGAASLYSRLLTLADAARVSRALPPAKARYLQVLLGARERRATGAHDAGGVSDVIVDVPIRLFPRVLDVVGSAELDRTAFAEALQLEIAAVSDGRTMTEWAALAALGLTR